MVWVIIYLKEGMRTSYHLLHSLCLSATPTEEVQELVNGQILPSQGMFSIGSNESYPLAHFLSINRMPDQGSSVLIRDGPEGLLQIINQKASASHYFSAQHITRTNLAEFVELIFYPFHSEIFL